MTSPRSVCRFGRPLPFVLRSAARRPRRWSISGGRLVALPCAPPGLRRVDGVTALVKPTGGESASARAPVGFGRPTRTCRRRWRQLHGSKPARPLALVAEIRLGQDRRSARLVLRAD